MQPCGVCGGVGIDTGGYCVHCRTYRGVTEQYPQLPGYGPVSGAPYPTSGDPYAIEAGRPAPDDYGRFQSGGYRRIPIPPDNTGTGVHGQLYPPPRNPDRRRPRRSLALPLTALAATLVILVIAIVVATATRNNGKGTTSLVDSCLVGTWTVSTMKVDIRTAELGTVNFTNVGEAGRMRFDPDGTGYHDYGEGGGVEFTADAGTGSTVRKVSLKVTGIVRYHVRTEDSTVWYQDTRTVGAATLTVVDTGTTSPVEFGVHGEPARYSCHSDTLTTFTEDYRLEARRSGV